MSAGDGQAGTSSSNRRRGRPPQDQKRRKKVLVEATPHMNRAALKTLRDMFDPADVGRAANMNPKTVRSDWTDDDGITPTDKFIVTLASDQLYGADAPWINDVWTKIVHQWPQHAGTPDEKFVDAIATIYAEMLQRSETIGRWLVHLFVASAQRSEPAADAGDAEHDARLVHDLLRLRQAFDEHVTMLWHLPLRVVLAEMERRPKDGVDERTIARELHTSMDGHVLRSLAEGGEPADDEGESVGRHLLFLLQGFTEREVPDQRPAADRIEPWVRDRAAHVTLERYRACAPSAADPSPDPDAADRDDLFRSLVGESEEIGETALRRAFDAAFPDMPALRDAALRRRLQPSVEAVQEMHSRLDGTVPGAVLRQLVSSVRAAGSTDSFLLGYCRRDHQNGAPSYLSELEVALGDLLVKLGTNEPEHVAGVLLEQALDGDHKAVEAMLAVIVPPESDERERAVLHQAAAAEQVGEELGEVGA